jgi:DNA-binding LytR/AlgR family response regulator
MTKIKCVIIDDEPLALDVLESYIKELEYLELIAKFQNVIEGINFLQLHKTDLLFLDIQMPKLTGIDLLKVLQPAPRVIFTTAYREYALQGYELNVLDYLLKPISFERFVIAVNKYRVNQSPDITPLTTSTIKAHNYDEAFIYLKSDKKMIKVFLKDINFIESLKDYVKVKTTDKEIVTYQKISYLEERLPDDKFIRIHRSYIIAIDKIKSFNATLIEINGNELPIGRQYKDEVMRILGESI